ncbi:hypothetical protein P0G10_19870, partial [Eubacteriales bacterium DFI.9.88]|nr:hypothetical protein [Eubacteriales bacterium DFI.9.88]
HPDLCNEYEDSRWSHACPLKRVVDEQIAPRDLAQIGKFIIGSYSGPDLDKLKNDQGVSLRTILGDPSPTECPSL